MDRDALGGKDVLNFETTAHIQFWAPENFWRKVRQKFSDCPKLYVRFPKQKKIETLVPAAHKKRRIIQKKHYHYTKN